MLKSRSNTGEDRFGDPKDKSTEIIQTEAKRKEEVRYTRALDTYGT